MGMGKKDKVLVVMERDRCSGDRRVNEEGSWEGYGRE